MATLKDLARYLVHSYEIFTRSQFDHSELKLQKLMYFAQRESLALTGLPLFEEPFEGWIHGPVLPQLRFFFNEDYKPYDVCEKNKLTETQRYVIDSVVAQYGKYEAWSLADLTHQEECWLKSRKGLLPDETGNRLITYDDIREDAKKVRPYDHIYDMFVDEFDDFTDEVLVL
ncbi:Panacea domain-containing protein [Enterococcus cecorum]|uniref:Panacea domain-containing protein n=1 Tax=Enterococcus cecorum TaxID=44008 RepID=UPI00148E610E|nr:type II toxin-antitoxin system antitoxin SocA domain-containing protein [Enterococcus cecorum]